MSQLYRECKTKNRLKIRTLVLVSTLKKEKKYLNER